MSLVACGFIFNACLVEEGTTFIVASRLLFMLAEHPEFRALIIEMAHLALAVPEIPTANTIRRHLRDIVKQR